MSDAYFFCTGLIIGSFLNVLVFRLRNNETLLGRSNCRHCGHQIRWFDNIPLVSFLFLRGKCRDCRASLSWQYPLLELSTAVSFLLVARSVFVLNDPSTYVVTLWLLGMISVFLTIAAYDRIHMEIPVSLLFAGLGITALYHGVALYQGGMFLTDTQWSSFFGALAVGGLFFLLVFFSHETWMGWGDVWLGGLSGAVVGFKSVLFLLTLSFGVGSLIGIALLLSGRKGMKTQLPFAPFLVAGTLLALFLPHFFPHLFSPFLFSSFSFPS